MVVEVYIVERLAVLVLITSDRGKENKGTEYDHDQKDDRKPLSITLTVEPLVPEEEGCVLDLQRFTQMIYDLLLIVPASFLFESIYISILRLNLAVFICFVGS